MRARGFSLIELLISVVISVIAIAGGVVLLLTSQQWFENGRDDRTLQENARVAMDSLTSNLRNAGYGLEPTFTFDMGLIANVPQSQIPQGDQARFGGYGYPNACNGTCRDSAVGPDDLVFYSRDPKWERGVQTVSSTNLTLVPPVAGLTTTLSAGQVLQIMCYGSSDEWLWAYVTVASVNSTNPGQVVVTLTGGGAQPYDFPQQNSLLTQPCFSAGTASVRAFKIDRYHYYIQAVNDATGAQVAWGTPGARPYLMLDQGLQVGGQEVLSPIAADVENLQVAYVYPAALVGNQIQCTNPGVQITANISGDDTGFNLAPVNGIPTFATPSLDPLRTTHNPANVRGVQVALTVRSPRADLRDTNPNDALVPASLNFQAVAADAGYKRLQFETTVYIRNMETRLPVYPQYDPNWQTNNCCTGTTCGGNCGGG